MELIELKEIFQIQKCQDIVTSEVEAAFNGVPLISSTEKNNGIVKRIKPVCGVRIFPAGAMTVARNGSVLTTCIQKEDFYVTCDVRVLIPKQKMIDKEKLFYKLAIETNKYRYSYGKKAGSQRLAELKLPVKIPQWIYSYDVKKSKEKFLKAVNTFFDKFNDDNESRCVFKGGRLDELFEINKGNKLSFESLTLAAEGVPFVGARNNSNGIVAYVKEIPGEPLQPAGSLSIGLQGNGGSCVAFLQPKAYYSNSVVAVLVPKVPMTTAERLYYKVAVTANHYKYSYGRGVNRTLPSLILPPVPEWVYKYDINSLRQKILRKTDSFMEGT